MQKDKKNRELQRGREARLREKCLVSIGDASIIDWGITVYARQVALTLHEITSHEGFEHKKKVLRKCFK
jgi:hypothetical protein